MNHSNSLYLRTMKYIDNVELLKCRFSNGMLMLPYFRYSLMCKLNSEEKKLTVVKRANTKHKIRNLLTHLYKIKTAQKDLMFISCTELNVKDDNGKFFNSLDGYYYNLYPYDSVLVEDGDSTYAWRTTDSYDNLSFINTYLEIYANIVSKIKYFFSRRTLSNAIKFSKFTNNIISVQTICIADYFVETYSILIYKLLKRVKPKILFVNCGTYGYKRSCILKVANSLNIMTVELQHGSIIDNHLAYSACEMEVNCKEYYDYLPREIWCFGKRWTESIKWGYKKRSIGNPYLNNFKVKGTFQSNCCDFLIISQPAVRNILVKFVQELAILFPDKVIHYRCHPSESASSYEDLFPSIDNLRILDSSSMLYADISNSKYIVGCYSTCLIEALAFKKNPIIIECNDSDKYFPKEIGIRVKHPKDLRLDILNRQESFNFEEYFDSNFEENVKREIVKYVSL